MRIGFLGSAEFCYNSISYFMNCIEEALNKEGIETLRILEDEVTEPLDAIIGINNTLPSEKMKMVYITWTFLDALCLIFF